MQDLLNYPEEAPRPLISFIVTTYNLPIEYITECLKSVMRLSLNKREREIILVDDGSDLTPLNELIDLRMRLSTCGKPTGDYLLPATWG